MKISFSNARQPGESFDGYRARLKRLQRGVKRYLQRGNRAVVARDGSRYQPGPHPSHKPKEIREQAIDKATGNLVDLVVTHPGTLMKVKILTRLLEIW